ncbi:DgyrCDS6385 [Dimorphilus gyrociliatus]|uniref:RAB6-interacting golgin n=1 Tax=Dimorphilus gyrociliatus TaxID=2664684 RepID=A0A7I8VQP8_9ANNE|nr:DgyrCDS6385 [Dimorphilus gyrociliatus]
MAGWAGFSEEELQKFKREINYDAKSKGPTKPKDVSQRRPRQQRSAQSKPGPQGRTKQTEDAVISNQNLKNSKEDIRADEKNNNESEDKTLNEEKKSCPPAPTSPSPKETEEISKDEGISREITAVEQFRIQQKVMEEQNKKKKQLLAEALIARQKRTKQEAVKLQKIKQQLEHLDHILSVDVSIVRDRIEEVSREYVEAQKRYDRAEKEFIDAKLDLHEKHEQKDQLTEHLYTIIHQNELRKAKKLTELMESLDLEDSENISVSIEGVPGATLLFEQGIEKKTQSNEKILNENTENIEKSVETKLSEESSAEKSKDTIEIEKTDSNSIDC